jgi:hypothetical protein
MSTDFGFTVCAWKTRIPVAKAMTRRLRGSRRKPEKATQGDKSRQRPTVKPSNYLDGGVKPARIRCFMRVQNKSPRRFRPVAQKQPWRQFEISNRRFQILRSASRPGCQGTISFYSLEITTGRFGRKKFYVRNFLCCCLLRTIFVCVCLESKTPLGAVSL